MNILRNDTLEIAINPIGAELCKITSVKHGTEFMWNGDSTIWNGFSPVLFPIIGALKNGTYHLGSNSYKLPKHGFVRHNEDIILDKKTYNSLCFALKHNNDLLKIYPFKFEFSITYVLNGNCIEIRHTIKNCDNKTMYFSVGGHPAFKCPVFKDEGYEDYALEFECIETAKTHLINLENGLITSKIAPVFNNSNRINLSHELFNKDALVFKELKSKKVSLNSKLHGNILTVGFTDFPYLGIWAKPEGDYVCIEPWLGIADNEDTNQDLKTKEGIITLTPNKIFEASYAIEINADHLV